MGAPDSSSKPIDWKRTHLWQIQPVRDVLLAIGVFGLLYLGDALSVVTVPILLALALAYLFEPVVKRMTRFSWISRQGAAAAIIAAIVLAVVIPVTIGAAVAVVQGIDFTTRFAANVAELNASVAAPNEPELYQALPNDSWRSLRDFFVQQEMEADEAGALRRAFDRAAMWASENSQVLGERALLTGVGVVSFALGAITSAGMLGFAAFLTLFFFFFFSTGYAKVLAFGEKLLPEKEKPTILRLLAKMDRVIAAFIRGRVVIAAIQSVTFTVGFLLAGVPAAFILGPFTGIVSIVPYAALVSLPVASLLLYVEPNFIEWQDAWWWTVFGPMAVYFPLQALDDYVLTPMIQGKETDMETPAILFASIAGGALFGPFGLLLGIPVAACVKILLNEIVWPRVHAWTRGETEDPLPIGRDN